MSYTNMPHSDDLALHICAGFDYVAAMTRLVERERLPGRTAMMPIILAVTREYKLTEEVLVQPGQSPTPLQARRVCAWLAEQLGVRLSPGEVGRALGRDRYAVFRGRALIAQHREKDSWLREMTDRLLAELSAA